jgi:hypothetical protein
VNYVKGTDRIIAKNRWFVSRELGGYGLIDINVMSICVKSAWFNKWVKQPQTIDLNGLKSGVRIATPIEQWRCNDRLRSSDPTTHGIFSAFTSYKRLFYRLSKNNGMALLFENDGLLEGKKNIGLDIFGEQRYNEIREFIINLKIFEFFSNGRLKDKAELEEQLHFRLNMAEYFRIRNFCMEINRIYGEITDTGISLDIFIREKRRGGGELRKAISGKNSNFRHTGDPREIPSAVSLWGARVMNSNVNLVMQNFGLWGNSKLDSNFKNFLFNLVQGRLYLNNVLMHIDGRSNKCTFCTITAKKELEERGINNERPEYQYYLDLQPRENVDHIFWDCEHVQNIIQKAYRWMRNMDWMRGNETISKESFFIGIWHQWSKVVTVDLIWKHFIKYYLYLQRLRHKLPTFASLKFEMEGLFLNKKMKQHCRSLQLLEVIYDVDDI